MIVKKLSTKSRTFAYQKNNCTISMTARTDIKQELKDCIEITKACLEEMQGALVELYPEEAKKQP